MDIFQNVSYKNECIADLHARFESFKTSNSALAECVKANKCIYDICNNISYEGYDDMYRFDQRWPLKYAVPMYAIVFPILLVFLILSNIFVLLILSQKHMVSPTNVVLLYMAVADLFVGLVPAPFTIFYFTMGYYKQQLLHETWWCYMGHYLMDVLPPVCHNVAIWLTVLLAAQRFMYIQYPVWAQKLCTITNVRWASLIIVLVSVFGNALKFYEAIFMVFRGLRVTHRYAMLNESTISDNSTTVDNHSSSAISDFGIENLAGSAFCIFRRTVVVETLGTAYYYIHIWFRVIFFIVVPSIALVVLNLLLINGLRKAQERRNRLLHENRPREANRQKESNNTSLMLVLVVSIFLIVNLPQAIFFSIFCIDMSFNLHTPFFVTEDANLFVMVDNMLFMATYPINFAIYCSTSTQFRDTFRQIFCPHAPTKVNRRSSTMTSYSYLLVDDPARKITIQQDVGSAAPNAECVRIK